MKLNGISFLTRSDWILIGYIMAATHNINSMLAILLPSTLDKASSVCPLKAAIIFMANSGAEVPKATMVNHIIRADIPNFLAKELAHFTSISALNINRGIQIASFAIAQIRLFSIYNFCKKFKSIFLIPYFGLKNFTIHILPQTSMISHSPKILCLILVPTQRSCCFWRREDEIS